MLENCQNSVGGGRLYPLSLYPILLAMLALITGCGGGGGATGSGSTGTTTASTTTTTLPTPKLESSFGTDGKNFNITDETTVSVTLKNASGNPLPNMVVTFSTDETLAIIDPSAKTALTNSSGAAAVKIRPASVTAKGAGQITAVATVDGNPVTWVSGYEIGASQVSLSDLVLGVSELSAYGTTSVAVDVTINGAVPTKPQLVTFSSSCTDNGKAKIDTSVTTVETTVSGSKRARATASFSDKGCGAIDTVKATVGGTSKTTQLSIRSPTAGSIQFVSATPSIINLKGTGGQETSEVSFKVVDTGGGALGGQQVSLTLSTTSVGVTFADGKTETTATTTTEGLVKAVVKAGAVSTPVRVMASVKASDSSTLATQSSQLTVTTGVPDQEGFSLSATKYNIDGKVDGAKSVLKVTLVDHFKNPPLPTVVNFTSEAGKINGAASGSCTTDSEGICTVTFTNTATQEPIDGRVTVLAYALGEESFTDLNGNGLADKGEMIDLNGSSTDTTSAYVDYNESGGYDSTTEPSIGTYVAKDGLYGGSLCNPLNADGTASTHCSSKKQVQIFRQLPIVLSDAVASIQIFPTSIDLKACTGSPQSVVITVTDSKGKVMPANTKIEVATTDGKLSTTSFTVPSTNAAIPGSFVTFISSDAIATSGSCTDTTLSGVLTVTVTVKSDEGLADKIYTSSIPVIN